MTNDGSVMSVGMFSVPVVTTSTVYAAAGASFASVADAQVAALNSAFMAFIQARHPMMDEGTARAVMAAAECDFDAISSYSTCLALAKAGNLVP